MYTAHFIIIATLIPKFIHYILIVHIQENNREVGYQFNHHVIKRLSDIRLDVFDDTWLYVGFRDKYYYYYSLLSFQIFKKLH